MGRKVLVGPCLAVLAVALAGCSGSSNSGGSAPGTTTPPPTAGDSGCTGSCANATTFLTAADVSTVLAQAVAEAQAQNAPATIAVVDRVGNTLAVYRMNGARSVVQITSNRGVTGGLEGLNVPSELAAIAKAITGAYLSSEGNAFSTRTASQIVQQHFNPGELGTPAGPLFGVQFSQLPCSDFSTRFVSGHGVGLGPFRSPLGLSADPGGFPLYKNGTVVGGIGVAADPQYTLDPNIFDKDRDLDELIATAGTFGFAPATDRRGDRITADGKTFRFSDVGFSDLIKAPGSAPPLSSLPAGVGGLIAVPDYFDGQILAGTAFGQPSSGYRADTTDFGDLDAFILVDSNNQNRYPPRAGTQGAGAPTASEVREVLRQSLMIANRARAQIRQPLDSQAHVTISVVDTNGVILGVARTRDAPIFGTEVSLQKARTAAFYSNTAAAADLQSLPTVSYFSANVVGGTAALTTVGHQSIAQYVTNVRTFLGQPNALSDGTAFTDRAGGNLSRPFYPDGIDGRSNGPFSHPFDQWSPFQVGLQEDLIYTQVALHVAHYLNAAGLAVSLDGQIIAPAPAPGQPPALGDVPPNCSGLPRLPNGIQIFPGSVPLYRNGTLIGGVGVSGDGVDQDDMVSFLGVHNAGVALNGAIGNAPPEKRADLLVPQGARLRYVQCPQAPFLNSTEQNVCEGK